MDRIDAMQAFVAVADLRGFAPAARKLGLSPSGVTRLIAALEDRLGARLLQRTTRQVTLTDAGSRYLERARRILADVEEAEDAIEGERTRPEGQLVISAPVGFGRLHVSGIVTAYLKRYGDVGVDLRLSDRMINLVEDGVDLAVRIGHLPDSTLVARHVGEMRRIVVASPGYLKKRGEPGRPQEISAHDTIQFGAMTAALDWRFVEDGREIRVASTPRLATNSSDAAIQYAEADGGLTRVMAYQAAELLKAGRLKDRIGVVRTAGDADPDRLSDVAAAVGQGAHLHRSRDRDGRLAFRLVRRLFLRHHAKRRVGPRDHDVIGLDQALRKADRSAGFDDVALHREPLPDLGGADEIDRKRDRHQRGHPAHAMGAAMAHRSVGKCGNQASVDQAAAVGVRFSQPQSNDDCFVGLFRVKRLPGIGEGTPAGATLETFGDVGGCHVWLAC